MSTQSVDYAALAKQYGATNSQGPVDYTALAQKFGATNSTTPEPTERFARSFNKAITGAETPQQYVEQHQFCIQAGRHFAGKRRARDRGLSESGGVQNNALLCVHREMSLGTHGNDREIHRAQHLFRHGTEQQLP